MSDDFASRLDDQYLQGEAAQDASDDRAIREEQDKLERLIENEDKMKPSLDELDQHDQEKYQNSPIVQDGVQCPDGWHRHIDPTTGRAMDPTRGDHSHEDPSIVGPYSEQWVNELFDLMGTAIEVTREVALRAAQSNTPEDWTKATHGIAGASESIDQVGRAFASHAAEMEFARNPFLQALRALIENNDGQVQIVNVD